MISQQQVRGAIRTIRDDCIDAYMALNDTVTNCSHGCGNDGTGEYCAVCAVSVAKIDKFNATAKLLFKALETMAGKD